MSTNLPTGPAAPPPGPPSMDVGSGGALSAPLEDWEESRAQSFNWRRYLNAVVRYKWIVLLALALGTGGGIVATRFVEPQYQAQLTIWIERGIQGQAAPIQAGGLLGGEQWLELLRSFVVLDHVVQELRLYVKPKSRADAPLFETFALAERFSPGEYRLRVDDAGRTFELTREGLVVQRGAVGEPIGAELGFIWTPPRQQLRAGRDVKFEVMIPRDAARELNNQLRAGLGGKGSNFIRVGLSGPDPVKIATTLNAIADRFIETATTLKREKLDEVTKILEGQLQVALQNLQSAELAYQNFKVETITLPSEQMLAASAAGNAAVGQGPAFSDYFNAKVEVEQLRRDRDAIRRALARAETGELSIVALDAIGAVQRSVELKQALAELTSQRANLRAMRHQYTDEHPAVKQVIAQIDSLENRTIPQLAGAVIAQLDARERDLGQFMDANAAELRAIPPRAIEEARLAREMAVQQNIYTTLQQNYEKNRLAAESSVPDVRVLDAAVPPREPSKNQAPQVLLMAILGSLGLGLAGAILLDMMDRRVRYPEQVTGGMGLPIIGVVPRVKSLNGRAGAENKAQLIESFRGIRLSLSHAYGAAGPVMLTVSSPGSGDGKSFISSNLALAFAELGERTLLIDGDIRRGALHRLFGVTRKPGLTDLLSGQATLDEVIRPTGHDSLYLIPSGSRLTNGPELLSSHAMVDLVQEVKQRFRTVLMDSAPLGAGVDPYALAALTGNLVLVLRTGTTDKELAMAKLGPMSRLPVRILGALLNDVSPDGLYGYTYYSYHSYLPGYELTEGEAQEEDSRTVPVV